MKKIKTNVLITVVTTIVGFIVQMVLTYIKDAYSRLDLNPYISIMWFILLTLIFLLLYFLLRKDPKSFSRIKLTKHDVFITIENKLSLINSFRMENIKKQKIFRSVLTQVVLIYSSEIHRFIKDFYRKPPETPQDLSFRFHELIIAFNIRLRSYYVDEPSVEEKNRPAYIKAVSCYLPVHEELQESMEAKISTIVNDTELYTSPIARAAELLTVVEFWISFIFINASSVLGCLNGSFSGMYFDDELIGK